MNKDEFEKLAGTWPEADYWSSDEDPEYLALLCPSEALEFKIASLWEKPIPDGPETETELRRLLEENGGELEIFCWTKDPVNTKELTEVMLDVFEETWHENYDNPDDDVGTPSNAFFAAIEAVIKEEVGKRNVWSCTRSGSVKLTTEQVIGIAKLEWPEWFETPCDESCPYGGMGPDCVGEKK